MKNTNSYVFKIFLLNLIITFFSCTTNKEKNDQSVKDSLTSKNDTFSAYVDPTLPPSDDYTGDHVVKYKNGITSIRGFFRFGKKHGKWASFFPAGTLQSEIEYDNGNRTGKSIVWYPNGKIMYEGFYKNNARAGEWITYDSTGKILEKKQFN